jgi:hypothetical protein
MAGGQNIVAVPLAALHCMRGRKSVALLIVEQPYQQAGRLGVAAAAADLIISSKPILHFVP